ncbi:hypothetical protein [Massilia sp. YMA4]|uniref:hypothetical protein n=1 Tax=Massilia sp. YMA4 TaxID=1593482 RepID=UPI000DD101B5|nr:hypothetical protein [Massilia sp. YMA4]AXA94151.1 hypothetical protein DPH57_25270 [Massilia sp. YMA4]
MSKRQYTTFEIYKRLSDVGMEHKHAVAIAESIGEFVEEREQAIRAELSSTHRRKDEISTLERASAATRPYSFLGSTVSVLGKDKPFTLLMFGAAVLWSVLIWEAWFK